MKLKQIITAALLLFVTASLIAVVIKERRGGADSSAGGAGLFDGDKTVVYYFHGNKRCMTCRQMERFTRMAIEETYGEELKKGAIVLKLVNLDESENAHYVTDYQMDNRLVVLSRIVAGKEVKWKRLERVWDLADDEAAFKAYINSEISAIQKGEI